MAPLRMFGTRWRFYRRDGATFDKYQWLHETVKIMLHVLCSLVFI